MKREHCELFDTDYYQIAMVGAYMYHGMANDRVGFELFCRDIKPTISPTNHYTMFNPFIVDKYVSAIKEEVKQKRVRDTLKQLIQVDLDEKLFDELESEFVISWPKEGSPIVPYMPVVQYIGPRWIGQLIESRLIQLVNSNVAEYTISHESGSYPFAPKWDDIRKQLYVRALEYKEAAGNIPLFDATFRRAYNMHVASEATVIAMQTGWSGTSNVSSYFNSGIDLSVIKGTIAHSFVMAFLTEEQAFDAWVEVYPNSTLLIDTYDVIEAAKLIVEKQYKISTVRIDSEPLDMYAREVRRILDEGGMQHVKIFLSGDITPERLIAMRGFKTPVDYVMAGTKYVNVPGLERYNCSFVYKLVYNEYNGNSWNPVKKANSKSSMPGLKRVSFSEDKVTIDPLTFSLKLVDEKIQYPGFYYDPTGYWKAAQDVNIEVECRKTVKCL